MSEEYALEDWQQSIAKTLFICGHHLKAVMLIRHFTKCNIKEAAAIEPALVTSTIPVIPVERAIAVCDTQRAYHHALLAAQSFFNVARVEEDHHVI